jgi:hypothetical protein
MWIKKHTDGCRRVDAVFAHVLLSFGRVPFEVYTCIIRVTRRCVNYVAMNSSPCQLSRQITVRPLSMDVAWCRVPGYFHRSGRAIWKAYRANVGMQDLTPNFPNSASAIEIRKPFSGSLNGNTTVATALRTWSLDTWGAVYGYHRSTFSSGSMCTLWSQQ